MSLVLSNMHHQPCMYQTQICSSATLAVPPKDGLRHGGDQDLKSRCKENTARASWLPHFWAWHAWEETGEQGLLKDVPPWELWGQSVDRAWLHETCSSAYFPLPLEAHKDEVQRTSLGLKKEENPSLSLTYFINKISCLLVNVIHFNKRCYAPRFCRFCVVGWRGKVQGCI